MREPAKSPVAVKPLELSGDALAVERGGRVIFRDVSFLARAGDLIWLSGPNGAGKTSLLKLISGFIAPFSGALTLSGGDAELPIAQQAHFVGHDQALKPALTTSENLQFWTRFLGGSKAEEGLEAFGLGPLAHLPAGVLSAGQQRRLSLARLIAIPRPIWLLDEAGVGLDPAWRDQLSAHMSRHLAQRGIIIAASHDEIGRHTSRIDLGGRP
jgi:heme exporter protein A